MVSRVLIGTRARSAILGSLLRTVRATNASLGPHGRALLFEATPGGVGFATDGLTIAREMAESEGVGSIGTRIVKETLFASDRDLGDGAARIAAVLGAVLTEGTKFVSAGYPPQRLADEILAVGGLVQQRLADQCHALPSLRALARAVANDPAVSDAIADAVATVGADGVVEVKELPGNGVDVRTGKGFFLEATLPSQHLGPAPPATSIELDDVFLLVANEVISDFGRLVPILEGFASRKKALAIVSRDVTGSALEALVRNRRELGLHVIAMKLADVSTRAGDVLEDLAIASRATLFAAEVGRALDTAKPSMLGRAKHLRFAGGRALFSEPAGDPAAIELRRDWLAREADKVRYLSYDREHLQRRAARLAGSWSEVGIGGTTAFETATRLTEARAVIAVLQAAQKSGVVAGGGAALVRESEWLRSGRKGTGDVERAARACVAHGLEAVAANIARNAGLEPTAAVARLRASSRSGVGLNALTGDMGDIIAAGIADPLSITRGVISRALSVAATVLRAEAVVGK